MVFLSVEDSLLIVAMVAFGLVLLSWGRLGEVGDEDDVV